MFQSSNITPDHIDTSRGYTILRNVRIGNTLQVDEVHLRTPEDFDQFQTVIRNTEKEDRRRIRLGLRARPLLANSKADKLSVEVNRYIAGIKFQGLHPRTVKVAERDFRLLRLACQDDLPADQIKAEHIHRFFEIMDIWPRSAHRTRFAGMTDEQILAVGRTLPAPRRADTTINLAHARLSAFFGLLEDSTDMRSPMRSVKKRKVRTLANKKRRPFRPEELAILFEPTRFAAWAKESPHRWFGTLIGLFTGARVSEVAQLKVKDIRKVAGHWCISIRMTTDDQWVPGEANESYQSLKCEPRDVLIPQALLDAGFLEFVQDMKAFGHPRLFPHLRRGMTRGTNELNGAGYGAKLTHEFCVYLRKHLNLPKGFGFHLFRHGIATSLRKMKVPVETRALITGHKEIYGARMLREVYEEEHTAEEKVLLQAEMFVDFVPAFSIPRYRSGQFDRALRTKKLYR
jgi:integrase